MITLDQIKQLDHKVRNAIEKIDTLKSENSMLQEKLDSYQLRIEELEVLIDTFKEDQSEIESGIIDALKQLDILEDNINLPEEEPVPAKDSPEQIIEDSEPEAETTAEIEESDENESESTDDSEKTDSELDIF